MQTGDLQDFKIMIDVCPIFTLAYNIQSVTLAYCKLIDLSN